MACTSPLVRQVLHGTWTVNGKPDGKILGGLKAFDDQTIDYFKSKPWDYQIIPCGNCAECRLQSSRQWADRCILESKGHKSNWFVTLTYDPTEVPCINTETGELFRGGNWIVDDDNNVLISQTLMPDDMTRYVKRQRIEVTRKQAGLESPRYYYCGEYGSNTARPHYHILWFGLEIPDLTVLKVKEGKIYYNSEWIKKTWGHGFVLIAELCWETAAYTARYCMKKIKGPGSEDYYRNLGILKEYVQMSRRPGIARQYFDANKSEIYKNDEIILPKGRIVKPCRYYDKLYDNEEPADMETIRRLRRAAQAQKEKRLAAQSTLSPRERLEAMERATKRKAKQLIRPDL